MSGDAHWAGSGWIGGRHPTISEAEAEALATTMPDDLAAQMGLRV